MLRGITRALAILVIVAIAILVLDFAELLVSARSRGMAMAPAIAACDGRVLAEGITYKIVDPEPGDIVVVHAAETVAGEVVPDEDARDRELILRVAGGPGDVVEGRDGSVFVNDVEFDDITTEPFLSVRVPNEQYFLLGDNRSVAIDSRTFGTVLGDPIFGKVFVTFWPLRDFSFRMGRESGEPPGATACD